MVVWYFDKVYFLYDDENEIHEKEVTYGQYPLCSQERYANKITSTFIIILKQCITQAPVDTLEIRF
jgi:hypothetical protein